MRIGVMLRSIDEKGGVGVYTRNIIAELLRFDRKNEYILLYRNPSNIGRFSMYKNAAERLVKGSNKAYWDQVAIPYTCWKEKFDIIFHPKFTVPLFAPCKAVMVVHGADWLIPEQAQYYSYWDVMYMKLMLPIYFNKASAIISVSQETTNNFNRLLKLPPDKVKTIYFAPARHFRRIKDQELLDQVRDRYHLPNKYILTLTKRQGDTRKNFGQILKAYSSYHGRTQQPYKLVVGGKDCHYLRDEYAIPQIGYGDDILFPGWIDQEDMPAVYSMADLYLYPSNLEAFPIPITEAMACGTPILTSNVNGLKEIAGDAAIMVDPSDSNAISEGISLILSNHKIRTSLSRKGLERSSHFTWDECAKTTLDLLETVASR
jgi:glycosyltransferase involved in cell wall biosynthesis